MADRIEAEDRWVPRGELIESGFFECQACADEYELLCEIVEDAGSDAYYDRAMAALQLAELFERYDWQPESVEAKALDELIIVRAEQARYEIQQIRNSQSKGAATE